MPASFEDQLVEGLALDVEAHWGAGLLPGRYRPGEPSWSYGQLCRPLLANARSALDMAPTVPAAAERLLPLNCPSPAPASTSC